MSAHDEQITDQAEQLGRMLARSGSFANAANALARGWAEVQTDDPRRQAFLTLLAADSLVTGATRTRSWRVQAARDAGLSWTEIGRALGVSKQAAQQRHSASAETATLSDPRANQR